MSPLPPAASFSAPQTQLPSTGAPVPASVPPTRDRYHDITPPQSAHSDTGVVTVNRLPVSDPPMSPSMQIGAGTVPYMQEVTQVSNDQKYHPSQPGHFLPGQSYSVNDMPRYGVASPPVRGPSLGAPQSPLPHMTNQSAAVPQSHPPQLNRPDVAQRGLQGFPQGQYSSPLPVSMGQPHPPVQVSQIAIVYSQPDPHQANSTTYTQPTPFPQQAVPQSIPQYQPNQNINHPPNREQNYPGRNYPAPFAVPASQFQPQQQPQSLSHHVVPLATQTQYSLSQSMPNSPMPPGTIAVSGQGHSQSHGSVFQGQMQANQYAPQANYHNSQPQAMPTLTTMTAPAFGPGVQQSQRHSTPVNPTMSNPGPNAGVNYQKTAGHPVVQQSHGFHPQQRYPPPGQTNYPPQPQVQQQQSGMGRGNPPQQYHPNQNYPSQTRVNINVANTAPQREMHYNQGYQHMQGHQQQVHNVSQTYPHPSGQIQPVNTAPYMSNPAQQTQMNSADNPHRMNQGPQQIPRKYSSEIHPYHQQGPNQQQQYPFKVTQANLHPPTPFSQNQSQLHPLNPTQSLPQRPPVQGNPNQPPAPFPQSIIRPQFDPGQISQAVHPHSKNGQRFQNPVQNFPQRPSMPGNANQSPPVPVATPNTQWGGNAPVVQPPVSQPQGPIRQPTYSQPISGQQVQGGRLPQPSGVPPSFHPVQFHPERPGQAPTPTPQMENQPQQNYLFKSQPRPGQYLSTPSNENSPKHGPSQPVVQNANVNQYSNIIKPMSVLKPEPVGSGSVQLAQELSQPSSDLAGLILTPTRNLSTSADELLSTNPDPTILPIKNDNQLVLVPTKVDEESESMVVRPVEGLPYMDEADLMKFKGQVTEFRDKVHNLLHKPKNNGLCLLDREWKQLSEEQEKYSRQLSTAVARCTSHKNRFQDIVPFDQSRVILRDAKDDYINASVIDGISPFCPRFIATQSPQPNTISDFWMMVYEQQVNLIVMLVNSKDLTKKCPIYWPADRAIPQQHGPLTVSFTTSKTHADLYVERTFTVKHKKQSLAMSVTQLQFIAWPEHRAPSSASDLIFFLNVVSNYHGLQRNLQWPVLVHCESGVGRTGVFCAFLAGISEINAGMGIVDVVSTVKKMRHKRKYMVQEKAQLKFVYDVILYHAIDVLKQRKVILEDVVKQLPLPQQVQKYSQPLPTSNQFDIFSDNSALSSIQATVEKMTIKAGDTKFDQPLISKSLSEIDTSMGVVIEPAHIQPSRPITTSHSFDSVAVDQRPAPDGLSDLIQGTMADPTGPEDPPCTVSPSQPDIVESCNNQTIPEKYGSVTILTQEVPIVPPASHPPLIDSLSPETFTLKSDDEQSKKIKKVTKEDFFKPRSGFIQESDPSDPFSGLDPLWGLKK